MQERIAAIREAMRAAALAAGRRPEDILLCAASKTQDAATVRACAALDVDLFGENHVQELAAKTDAGAYLDKPCHLIGHLQTNKVRQTVGRAAVIQSVDSLRLMDAIEKEAARQDLVQDIFLELNIGGEAQKTGADPALFQEMLDRAELHAHLRITGLMTVPPAGLSEADTRGIFARLRRLFEDTAALRSSEHIRLQWLSMGMSSDYPLAILEGANIVRVGTAIFGPRDYSH